MTDELTRPEMAAELHLQRRANPGDGCFNCQRRVESNGWTDCGLTPPLRYPQCTQRAMGYVRDLSVKRAA